MLRCTLVLLGAIGTRAAGFAKAPLRKVFKGKEELRALGTDVGDKVFLSDYLKDPEAGQTASTVPSSMMANSESYAGYVTVNATHDANMFTWFFPAQSGDPKAPVLLWLQGGPGGSSLYGLFSEIGPLNVKGSSAVQMPISWNSKYSLLFIDNPVGTGYSYANRQYYTTNEVEVGRDLYSCLTQWFTVFPQYAKNDFYVTGESYAGKYIPAVAYTIHQHQKGGKGTQPKGKPWINLVGLAIGDGLTDPASMMPEYPTLAYSFGLADQNEVAMIKAYTDRTSQAIAAKQWKEAFMWFDLVLNGDLCKCTPYMANITGSADYFNVIEEMFPPPTWANDWGAWVNTDAVRKAIHVGDQPFGAGSEVDIALESDVMQSVKPWFPTLLANYRVMLYNGNIDFIVHAVLTETFLHSLEWPGAAKFKAAPKALWKVEESDEFTAGYAREVDNLTQVVVRAAGHMVPMDQPRRAFDMIDRFVSQTGFGKPLPVNPARN
jgi:vitellogenic carboxypeptidase-like protein